LLTDEGFAKQTPLVAASAAADTDFLSEREQVDKNARRMDVRFGCTFYRISHRERVRFLCRYVASDLLASHLAVRPAWENVNNAHSRLQVPSTPWMLGCDCPNGFESAL
jgi:hypothetical protein